MSLLQQPTPTHGFALTDYLLHHKLQLHEREGKEYNHAH